MVQPVLYPVSVIVLDEEWKKTVASSSFTEESEEVRSAVDLRHGRLGVVCQNVRVLRPLEFVEQLRSEHDVEIFPHAGDDLVNSKLSAETHGDINLL